MKLKLLLCLSLLNLCAADTRSDVLYKTMKLYNTSSSHEIEIKYNGHTYILPKCLNQSEKGGVEIPMQFEKLRYGYYTFNCIGINYRTYLSLAAYLNKDLIAESKQKGDLRFCLDGYCTTMNQWWDIENNKLNINYEAVTNKWNMHHEKNGIFIMCWKATQVLSADQTM